MKTRLNVLLVEDEPSHARLAQAALDGADLTDFEVRHVTSVAKAIDEAAGAEFDAILLDLGLPDCRGIEALVRLRQAHGDIPIVVLTADNDQSTAVEAVAQGAQDYLYKGDLNGRLLERVIRHAVGRHRMVRQLRDANRRLDRQNKDLEQVCETAHQFVDHVSHEFRSPLTVIKEFVTILCDGLAGEISDQQREFLDIVNDRADDLAVMVDDMLDVSKLEAGLLSVWRRRCRIGDIVNHVRPMLERKASVKNVRFSVCLEEDLAEVYCDPEKTGRVILNLVINAIKFCGQGGTVKLWARQSHKTPEVVLGVTDDGPGIAKKDLTRIFHRFHQVGQGAGGGCRGFGLGLSIAKELAGLNLGDISIESEPNQGSTFSFGVPLCDPTHLAARYVRRLKQSPEDTWAALASAEVTVAVEPGVFTVLDEFLQHAFRGSDLVIRTGPRKWLVLARCGPRDTGAMLDRVRSAWGELNRNRPGHPLPEIELHVEGVWRVKSQAEQMLQRCRRELGPSDSRRAAPRVLVVDDDRELVRGLAIRLTAAGYEVLTATDPTAGFAAAVGQRPDAILLDNIGLDTLNRLHAHPDTAAIPVVMLSASAREGQKALKHGVRFFLRKPCDTSTVVDVLGRAISKPTAPGGTAHDTQAYSYSR